MFLIIFILLFCFQLSFADENQSKAAERAREVYSGRVLAVDKFEKNMDSTKKHAEVYRVKILKEGQVRIIYIDSVTGEIIDR